VPIVGASAAAADPAVKISADGRQRDRHDQPVQREREQGQ